MKVTAFWEGEPMTVRASRAKLLVTGGHFFISTGERAEGESGRTTSQRFDGPNHFRPMLTRSHTFRGNL